ncbi:diguanylate cyclase domain-containing protein [Crenothrix sp.]|uniref:diguanylate cyclase domain-containing protein n=1 Tax=Crenothrix sp. TaxID=3100433 RepID=UPI00374D6764
MIFNLTFAFYGSRFFPVKASKPVSPEHAFVAQLQQSRAELVEVKLALASCQQQLSIAQQQIDVLLETNARIKHESLGLAEKYAQALHCSHHDVLTGLPNRNLLRDRLQQTMAQSARQQKQVALLFIDLDKFKSINDTLGHAVGDKLLQQVAKRLVSCVRQGDTVCRYGGDEFVIMLTEIDTQESAALMTAKIRKRLCASYILGEHVVTVTASIGIAFHGAEGQDYSDLINQADNAMYRVKVAQRTNNNSSFLF